jgi:hypothetical protein
MARLVKPVDVPHVVVALREAVKAAAATCEAIGP